MGGSPDDMPCTLTWRAKNKQNPSSRLHDGVGVGLGGGSGEARRRGIYVQGQHIHGTGAHA